MSYEIVPPGPSRRSARAERPAVPIRGERPVSAEIPVYGLGPMPAGGHASDTALRRYLLARALGASIVRTVYWSGVALLALSIVLWIAGLKLLAVPVGVVAVVVLLVRKLLKSVARRISGVDEMGTAGPRVEQLVGQTRRGLRQELRRIGLPSAPWGPTLIALRLLRPTRRVATVRSLTRFDLTQVVPTATLDELQLLLSGHGR